MPSHLNFANYQANASSILNNFDASAVYNSATGAWNLKDNAGNSLISATTSAITLSKATTIGPTAGETHTIRHSVTLGLAASTTYSNTPTITLTPQDTVATQGQNYGLFETVISKSPQDNDTGSASVMVFKVRTSTPGAVANRAVAFEWLNHTTRVMSITPAGAVQIGPIGGAAETTISHSMGWGKTSYISWQRQTNYVVNAFVDDAGSPRLEIGYSKASGGWLTGDAANDVFIGSNAGAINFSTNRGTIHMKIANGGAVQIPISTTHTFGTTSASGSTDMLVKFIGSGAVNSRILFATNGGGGERGGFGYDNSDGLMTLYAGNFATKAIQYNSTGAVTIGPSSGYTSLRHSIYCEETATAGSINKYIIININGAAYKMAVYNA